MPSMTARAAFLFALLVSQLASLTTTRAEVILDQVVSRESPLFNCKAARMTVGRDGLVYLTSTTNGKGFCLRLARDGSSKLGGEVVYAIHNATANKDGLIATANTHFSHSLNLYEKNFNKLQTQDDFLVNDTVGWDAPLHVEAGSQSGEFYGLDQHRNRVVRVGVDGKVKAVYPVRAEHEDDWGKPQSFRVSELLQSFFYLSKGQWIRSKFDGSVVWKSKLPVHFDWSSGGHGGFDIDDAGTTYFVEATSDVLKRLDADGKPMPDVKLDSGDLKPTRTEPIVAIRVFGNDLVLRRASPTELFQVFDLTTGKRKHVESIVYERLTVTFPSLVWTNGENVPLKVAFAQSEGTEQKPFNRDPLGSASRDSTSNVAHPKPEADKESSVPATSNADALPRGSRLNGPRFRVWLTPFGISDWQELERDAESNIVVPADYAGLYQLKVSPEVTPRQTAEPSEYLVREIIEVRKPNSQGTIAVVTPLNRQFYEGNDVIKGRVIVRAKEVERWRSVELALLRGRRELPVAPRTRDDEIHDRPVVKRWRYDVRDDKTTDGKLKLVPHPDLPGTAVVEFELPLGNVTHLERGEYQLVGSIKGFVAGQGFTEVPQNLVIRDVWLVNILQKVRTTLYGDYGITFPQRNAWESADAAIAHGDRMQKLGFNQFVNRANWQLSLDFANDDNGRGLLNRVKERLQKDPLAVTPEKAEFGSAHHQIAEVYSANGWRELLLLVNMDGGLPIGTGFDTRKPEQFAESIKRYTEAFASYGAFAGWTWVANWWLYDLNAKFKTPDEKPKYEAALKVARETGKWDPILDQVEDRKFQFAVDAQESFNKTLREVEESRLSLRERTQGASEQPSDAGNKGASFRGAKGDNFPRRFITASAGPYRRPEVLNDINFRNVDEIDVQYQAEQITTPDWLHHAVDNSKRFSQPAWTHPELWNDFGTGEQIVPSTWLAVMRGAGGIGTAGTVPNWPNVSMDSRGGYHGTTSVFRATNWLFDGDDVAAWARWGRVNAEALCEDDRVGIIVSPRQVKIETFSNGLGSPTFSRQFEAYQSFLYANCAARFVTLEEIKLKAERPELFGKNGADELPPLERRFDALLLVGQTVELEPEWQLFLQQAKAAGIRVLADGTSRREVCRDAEELGLKFDFVEKEHSANNDHAFYTYPARFLANAEALAPTVQQLKANSKRRKDIVSIVGVQGAERPVVLVRERFNSARDPKEPAARVVCVVNNTPTPLEPGQLRRVGRAIATRAPVIARLKFDVPPDFSIIDEMANKVVDPDCIADLRDTYGRVYFVGRKDVVEARMARQREHPASPKSPAPMRDPHAEQQLFGPHLRDVAISHDGKTALLNAFNWDDNLYGLDLETGRELPPQRVKFKGRVGDHFAYAPKATKAGFFVQGFELDSAEGYQLFSLECGDSSPLSVAQRPLDAGVGEKEKKDLVVTPESASGSKSDTSRSRSKEGGKAAKGESGDESPHSKLKVARRYSLPALPGCLTGWAFTAWIQDRVNNFAVPPSGEWVAGSGNLGIAAWKREGELLWAQDWSREKRQTCLIEALEESTLLVAEGRVLKAVEASTGKPKWQVLLADSGEVLGLHPARDGKSVSVRTNTGGGTVFVVREGAVTAKLLTAADDLSQSDDGSLIAVTTGHQLRAFEVPKAAEKQENRTTDFQSVAPIDGLEVRRTTGSKDYSVPLSWLAHGDDQLRFPRVSADGRHIAVSSELGTVYVFSREGRKQHERDEFSVCVPAWLPNDDLLLASWMGTVTRVDVEFKTLWRTHVRDGEKLDVGAIAARGGVAPQLPAESRSDSATKMPTSRVTSWIAATDKIPELKNLLQPNQFIAKFMLGDFAATPNHPVNELVDGKWKSRANLPARPNGDVEPKREARTGQETRPTESNWLNWLDHGMIESGWRGEFALVVDSFNKQLRVDSLTFIEDAAHPESWLRDMKLEYWNADAEKWVFAEYLTSDSAVHHHVLKKPIEAARFRFVKADGHAWPAGNVRLQKVMLHGDVIGASHPDVVAKRPVAVLFDENVASVKGSYEHGHNFGLKFATGAEAFSGGNYITLPGDKNYSALWQPPFGHMTPNWWFEVVEKPEPGQYRFLQFSVKALAPETKGITLRVAPNHFGGVAVHVGEPSKSEGATLHQASGAVPFEWHTVTVDLWELLPENQRGKPFNIGAMSLGTVGGPAAIDRIRLGRTKDDLRGK